MAITGIMRRLAPLGMALLLGACAGARSLLPTGTAGQEVGSLPGVASAPLPPEAAAPSGATAKPYRAARQETKPAQVYPGTGRFVNLEVAARKAPPPPEPGDFTLNFVDADIRDVVKAVLGDLLNLNYVIDPQVQGPVTVQTSRPLPRSAVLPTLEILLQMQNAALVPADGLYKVVPLANAARGGPAPQSGRGASAAGYGVRIVPLRYIAAEDMQKILEPFLAEGTTLQADSARNVLVISGTSQELQRLQDTVDIFDVNVLKGMSVGIYTLHSADIKAVVEDLNSILGDKAEGPYAGMFRFAPVERLNAVLVVTPQPEYLNEARVWVERLDRGGENDTEQRLYVYQVQNGKADHLASLLNDLFGSPEQQGPPGVGTPGLLEVTSAPEPFGTPPLAVRAEEAAQVATQAAAEADAQAAARAVAQAAAQRPTTVTAPAPAAPAQPAPAQTPPPTPAPATPQAAAPSAAAGPAALFAAAAQAAAQAAAAGQRPAAAPTASAAPPPSAPPRTTAAVGLPAAAAPAAEAAAGGVSPTQPVRIVADTDNNALLIYATPRDYDAILATVRKLDVVPRQVLIEATIADVTLSGNLQYGLQWYFTNAVGKYKGTGLVNSASNAITLPAPAVGRVAGFSYALTDAADVVHALLVALANESKVRILSSPHLMVLDNQSAQIRVGTQVPVPGPTSVSSGAVQTTSVQFRDTGVLLEILPRVNAGGLVTLELRQEVSAPLPQPIQAGNQSSSGFNQRVIATKVAVQSGQSIVLGGLIKDNKSAATTGVPVLSKLPVVGPLFGTETSNTSHNELIVIMTPRVVRDQREVADITEQFKAKLQGLSFFTR